MNSLLVITAKIVLLGVALVIITTTTISLAISAIEIISGLFN